MIKDFLKAHDHIAISVQHECDFYIVEIYNTKLNPWSPIYTHIIPDEEAEMFAGDFEPMVISTAENGLKEYERKYKNGKD
jgi:hypothetical protein